MSAKKAASDLAKKAQSVADRRQAEAELRMLIVKFAPSHQRLVDAMRRRLRKRLPTAHEVVYEYRDCFVISYSPSEHGYEGTVAIRANEDGVRLYFNRAKELPDAAKLLQGAGGQTRWLRVDAAATLAQPEVSCLIEAAIAHSEAQFEPTGRGSVVIRPTSAKRRRTEGKG